MEKVITVKEAIEWAKAYCTRNWAIIGVSLMTDEGEMYCTKQGMAYPIKEARRMGLVD
tara:strand:+ start:420 stop:593 length:174 start_codon:yes stop_codon:yes gene_type:complete